MSKERLLLERRGLRNKTLALICLLSCKQMAFAGAADGVYSRFAGNIVTLDTYDRTLIRKGQGSGVVVEGDTGNAIRQVLHGPWILTNYHVIKRAGLIVATAQDGTKSNAWVVFFDRDRDIALIQTHVPMKSAKIAAAGETKVGDEVFAIGAPQGLGWTLSGGIVSALRSKGDQEVVQTSAAISPGSSGGGLFAANGELLGITSFEVKDGQNLNFAIRITPAFLASLKQFRGKGAQAPVSIPECDWNTGHTEPTNFDPEQPLAIPAWHSKWERMKIWDAHVQVIETIEKRLAKLTDTMSESDMTHLRMQELRKEVKRAQPSTNEVIRLQKERDQAYSLRYREFPDDIEGWDHDMTRVINQNAMPATSSKGTTREVVLGVQRAIKRWPTDRRVIQHLLFIVQYLKGDVREEVRSSLFRHVEKIVTELPSQREAREFIKPFEKSAGEFHDLEVHIRELATTIYDFVGPSGALGVDDQRQENLAYRLRQKGWLSKEKLGGIPPPS